MSDVWSAESGSRIMAGALIASTILSRTPLAFAALVSLTAMSIALYYGIVFIERTAVPWAPKN